MDRIESLKKFADFTQRLKALNDLAEQFPRKPVSALPTPAAPEEPL